MAVPTLAGCTVLVVDDEAMVAEELAAGLLRHGLEALHETCPFRALEILERDAAITVLVTDLRMPGMDGITLARETLARRDAASAIAIVMITADGDRMRIAAALDGGFAAFLRKPFRTALAAEAVREAHAAASRLRAGVPGPVTA